MSCIECDRPSLARGLCPTHYSRAYRAAGGPVFIPGASTASESLTSREALDAVDAAIIAAVAEDKPVTVRGVFYRVVSAGAAEKSEAGYRRVSRRLLKLRRDRLVSYRDIVDGTRPTYRIRSYSSAEAAVEATGRSYRQALWEDQDAEVMIVTEKDAISGAIMPVTSRWDVPLTVLRGYASESAAYDLADRVSDAVSEERTVYLYQLGDHDPSGVDAWRSFTERVTAFCDDEFYCEPPEFERLAVTPEQIEELGLPTRPTKQTDTRAAGFDGESVEVDAIPARTLRGIVEDAITQHIDSEQLAQTRLVEAAEKDILLGLAGVVG
jgi:hypothetical protein